MRIHEKSIYLGDGVYIRFDGYHYVLETFGSGINADIVENRIYLDSSTLRALLTLVDDREAEGGYEQASKAD